MNLVIVIWWPTVTLQTRTPAARGDATIPEHLFFVLGDNRDHANDGRHLDDSRGKYRGYVEYLLAIRILVTVWCRQRPVAVGLTTLSGLRTTVFMTNVEPTGGSWL